MSLTIAKPVRQFAALALLAGVLAVAWFAAIAPVLNTILALDTEIADKRAALGALRATDDLERRARTLGERAQSLDQKTMTLPGDGAAVQSANLQGALAGIAGTHGLRLKSTRTLAARDSGPLRLIGVAAAFDAPPDKLSDLLGAIDAHTPRLVVSGIRIVPAAPGAPDAADTGATLETEIEVYAPAGRSAADGKG